MTQNQRIIINTAATYGRTIISVACGIFTARWVLMALGQVDFGLYGLIGSVVIFVSFLNIQFANAIVRYYSYAVGAANNEDNVNKGLEEKRAWFSTAVLIHTTFPLILVCIGYPLGVYAIQNGAMKIPVERIVASIWIWRFVCLSTFIAMINVPFQAMYTAKQYIAELTIYSLFQTLARTGFIWYMANHPGEWLIKYGFAMMIISVIPQILICGRACLVFEECRLRLHVWHQWWRVVALGKFAMWNGIGGLGYIASHQGMSVVINNFFGARVTGSYAIAHTVSGEAASLTGALQGAFSPAISTSYGANNINGVRSMAYCVSKFGTVLTLVFSLPLMLEIKEVLSLWLINPPPKAAEMCVCVLLFMILEKLTLGHILAVNATGRIAIFQSARGILRAFVIPLAIFAYFCRQDVVLVTAMLPVSVIFVDICDVLLARKYIGLSIRHWLFSIVYPICIVSFVCASVGCIPRFLLTESLLRIIITTILFLLFFLPLSWFVILSPDERWFVMSRVARLISKRR